MTAAVCCLARATQACSTRRRAAPVLPATPNSAGRASSARRAGQFGALNGTIRRAETASFAALNSSPRRAEQRRTLPGRPPPALDSALDRAYD